MATPPDGQADPARIRVYDQPHALVTITGATEAAVMRRAGAWLEELDGAVVILSMNWGGDVADDSDDPMYQLDLTVDMSIAVTEGKWPNDWFRA